MKKGLTAVVICTLLVLLVPQAVRAAPPACPCTPGVHIVRWGETLWGLSRWYGTTVEAIAQANGIVNPHCIYAGQRLVISLPAPRGAAPKGRRGSRDRGASRRDRP